MDPVDAQQSIPYVFRHAATPFMPAWGRDRADPELAPRCLNDQEVVVGKTEEITENRFVGGSNRWSYDSFVNWEFW